MRHQFLSIVTCGALALAAGACGSGPDTTPAAEVQSQTAQPASMPMTVTGCLKAGDADQTFVVTSERAEGGGDGATYQLVGGMAPDLGEHVGRRVEVNGTVESQQAITSRAAAETVDAEQPTGTAGTPTVQTKTEVQIRRLSVDAIAPLDGEC